ncbi:MAG: hypothetical protein ABIH39_03530 [Candidatus Margulisiibacteriota bacterium]
MSADTQLIDPSFNLAEDLKSFRFDESLLAAVRLPQYYRADPYAPQLKWLILTDRHLILSGRDILRQFRLSRVSGINLTRDREGYTRINIQYLWDTYVIKGYFGGLESRIVRTLQLAFNFTQSCSSNNRFLQVFNNIPRIYISVVFWVALLGVIWWAIINTALTT